MLKAPAPAGCRSCSHLASRILSGRSNRAPRGSPGHLHRLAARAGLDDALVTTPRPPKEPQDKEQRWKWVESADSQRAHAALAGVLILGALPWAQQFSTTSIFYFASLAVCTIYIGAHKSLSGGPRQQLSMKEGLLAPVAASFSLFGVYLVLKYFPDLSFQTFIDVYFFLLGSFSISNAASSLLRAVGPLGDKTIVFKDLPEWLLMDEEGRPMTHSESAPADWIGAAIGVALAGAEVATHHNIFTLSNLVACTVASDILQLVGIRSFRTATVLLLGLLVYDIFWVFGSPAFTGGDSVMVTVATSDLLNAPTRLLYPRAGGGSTADLAGFPFSLLGLGDVAVPGLLACLALRYDASRVIDMRPRAIASFEAIDSALSGLPEDANRGDMGDAAAAAAFRAYDDIADADDARRTASTSESDTDAPPQERGLVASDAVLQQRRYFTPVMIAYLVGLGVAFGANAVSGQGQPALLYLCPLTLGAVAITALTRRELRRVWAFVDLPSSLPKLRPDSGK